MAGPWDEPMTEGAAKAAPSFVLPRRISWTFIHDMVLNGSFLWFLYAHAIPFTLTLALPYKLLLLTAIALTGATSIMLIGTAILMVLFLPTLRRNNIGF